MTKKTSELDKALGKKLADYRTAKGVSRKQMADAIGITHQQIHKYEKGMNRISVSRLYQICEYLSINPNMLLNIVSEEKKKHSFSAENEPLVDEILAHLSMIDDMGKLNAIKNLTKAMGKK